MSRNSPEGAIAFILWRLYEMALPDTPFQMGLAIVEHKSGRIFRGEQ